jgi:hypothetical protein
MSALKPIGIAQHVLSLCPLPSFYSQEDRIKWALRYISEQYQTEIQPLLDMLYDIQSRQPSVTMTLDQLEGLSICKSDLLIPPL